MKDLNTEEDLDILVRRTGLIKRSFILIVQNAKSLFQVRIFGVIWLLELGTAEEEKNFNPKFTSSAISNGKFKYHRNDTRC